MTPLDASVLRKFGHKKRHAKRQMCPLYLQLTLPNHSDSNSDLRNLAVAVAVGVRVGERRGRASGTARLACRHACGAKACAQGQRVWEPTRAGAGATPYPWSRRPTEFRACMKFRANVGQINLGI